MNCEVQNDTAHPCQGEVNERHDGRNLCWVHWRRKLPKPAPKVTPKPTTPAQDSAARGAIRTAIHQRDEIVMGRDPLGNLCQCGCNEPLPGDRGQE